MTVRVNISAGEFFELIRPAAIILSGFVSTGILVSARKHYSIYTSLLWAFLTLIFPLITVPLYWAVLLLWKPARIETDRLQWRLVGPALYFCTIMAGSIAYLYSQEHSVDAHLFRAEQAKVNSDSTKAITEYRKALALEENPHTRKLLALELYKSGDLENALREFRTAESGGEPDDSLSFVIGSLLEELRRPSEALAEYQRFLTTNACLSQPVDVRCEAVKAKLRRPEFNSDANPAGIAH